MFEVKGKYTSAKVMIDNIEPGCLAQIEHFVDHPAFTNPVAIMPDTHNGKGSVIGFTMPLGDMIIPEVIGVDTGCGMLSFCIGKELPMPLEELDKQIRESIPFGMHTHSRPMINFAEMFPWKSAYRIADQLNVNRDGESFKTRLLKAHLYKYMKGTSFLDYINNAPVPEYGIDWFHRKCETIGVSVNKIMNAIGTLGGGNHFLESGIDQNDNYWITIHTGSRNFGKRICDYWQNVAKKNLVDKCSININDEICKLKKEFTGETLNNKIKELHDTARSKTDTKGLEYLEGYDAIGYLYDMVFCQMYAKTNRDVIKSIILKILGNPLVINNIDTAHNFIDFEDLIIRKGAIKSYKDEYMIIPLNMRDGILICEGKSNPEWNYSAPHEAGRILSRSKAKSTLNLEDFKAQMNGVYSTSVGQGTLDEAPGAYKDSAMIKNAIGPTATILNKIRPIHNMKGSSKSTAPWLKTQRVSSPKLINMIEGNMDCFKQK